MTEFLYHYYEAETGPFANLSSLPLEEARCILNELRREGAVFAGRRSDDYLEIRRELEERAYLLFISKGGKPAKRYPHYFTYGPCDWIRQWYKNGRQIRIPLHAFDPETISFTYGDLFPTMRYKDDKPYRGVLYPWSEIGTIVEQFGLPQEWNADGSLGPERYIEVQVWDDDAIDRWKTACTYEA